MKPSLFTFDIFGTVVDWRRGMEHSLARRGRSLSVTDFDRVMDAQGRDQQGQFLPYREITARSLVSELGLGQVEAEEIGIENADYDLDVATSLGLSTVFVTRPHRRPGPAHVTVSNLLELAELVRAAG